MSILGACDVFNEYFEMIPAISDELKHEVYKLRYQVYCLEKEYKNPKEFPNQMEFDEYDPQSSHYLIRNRRLDIYMATTRLILPDTNNPENLFPIERHSKIDNPELLQNISRENLAELSRLCVSKEFRRRKNEQHLITTNDSSSFIGDYEEEKRCYSILTLALFACAIKISSENNIQYWYAIMEPALMRAFSMLGIYFVGIGPLVDYYGLRRPCLIKVDDLLESVAKKDSNSWNMLTNNGELRNSKLSALTYISINSLQVQENRLIKS